MVLLAGRHLHRALWVARVLTLTLGLAIVVFLLNKQYSFVLDKDLRPKPAAAEVHAVVGRSSGVPDDEGILDDGKGSAKEDSDGTVQREVASAIDRLASMLGWAHGYDDDTSQLVHYEADVDRIRVKDLRPLEELGQLAPWQRGEGETVGPSTEWADSALLRAFMARFGASRTTPAPASAAAIHVGEMKDFVASTPPPTTTTGAPESEPSPTPPPWLPFCPLNGVITTQEAEGGGGGIGGKIFEYSAAWLVSRGVGAGWRPALVPAGVVRSLSPLFEHLSLPTLDQLPPPCALTPRALEAATALGERDLADLHALPPRFLDPASPLVVRSGVLLPHLLVNNLAGLRQELTPRRELRTAATWLLAVCRQQLLTATKQDADDTDLPPVAFVAVHVRSMDVAPWWQPRKRFRPLGVEYFQSAVSLVRSRLAERSVTPVFVVTTDDPERARRVLPSGPDVCVTMANAEHENDGVVDFAAQVSCEHAILDRSATSLAAAIIGQVHEDALVVAPKDVAAGLAEMPGWTFL